MRSMRERVVREIRALRAMWRVLETEPRQFLTGHEEGNLGYMPRRSLRANAPAPDPTAEQNPIRASGVTASDLLTLNKRPGSQVPALFFGGFSMLRVTPLFTLRRP